MKKSKFQIKVRGKAGSRETSSGRRLKPEPSQKSEETAVGMESDSQISHQARGKVPGWQRPEGLRASGSRANPVGRNPCAKTLRPGKCML